MDGFNSILNTPLPPINLFLGGESVHSNATTVPLVLPDRRSLSAAELNQQYEVLAQQIQHLTAELQILKRKDDTRTPDEINLDLFRTHLCDLNTDVEYRLKWIIYTMQCRLSNCKTQFLDLLDKIQLKNKDGFMPKEFSTWIQALVRLHEELRDVPGSAFTDMRAVMKRIASSISFAPMRRLIESWFSSLLEIELLSLHRCVFGQRGVMCVGSRVQGKVEQVEGGVSCVDAGKR